MSVQEQVRQQSEPDVEDPRLVDALVALEVNARLLVHAWAALELGDVAQVQSLLSAAAERSAGVMDKLSGSDAQRETVRMEAREDVKAVIGW